METLHEFGTAIWTADGPIVRGFGFPFPTRMIVVKLTGGGLWINSPVEATFDEMTKLAQLGPVQHLVSPTPLHDWRLESWSKVFPNAQCWRATSLTDEAPPAWTGELDQLVFRGSRLLNEVQFLHRASRTVIIGDFIQNYAPSNNALRNALFTWAGVDGGTPVDARLSFAGNKALGRASLQRLLSWDFDKVILAHGECVTRDAKPFVRHAFRWLVAERDRAAN